MSSGHTFEDSVGKREGSLLVEEASPSMQPPPREVRRLDPARGLVLGLAISAGLWVLIWWAFF